MRNRPVPFRLAVGALMPAMLGPVLVAEARAEQFRFHADHVLGTSLDVAVTARNKAVAEQAFRAIQAEIARLDRVLSGHRADSELAALNAAAGAQVSPDLFAVLAACEGWRQRSGNGFSCRLGGAIAQWQDAARHGTPPDRAAMRVLAGELAEATVRLDANARRVTRPAAVRFALDGLAKGYVIDAALKAGRAAAPAATGMLVDIGGDARGWGQAPDGDGWRIGIAAGAQPDNAAPGLLLGLADRAVATSGSGARDLVAGDQAYSHLLSPEDGWPVERSVRVTAVAPTALEADALATALAVMPVRAGLDLAAGTAGAEALVVAKDGRRYATRGWWGLVRGGSAAPGQGAWGDAALTIDYQVPEIAGERAKHPYVALWVTGLDKQLVRGLVMLGDHPRWIEENYVWWRRYGRKTDSLVDAISRPTRAPGRYSFAWDGRDDFGQPVPAGRYLLHIEAAREHGEHSYQSHEIEVGGAPFERSLPGEGEIGAARIRFGATK